MIQATLRADSCPEALGGPAGHPRTYTRFTILRPAAPSLGLPSRCRTCPRGAFLGSGCIQSESLCILSSFAGSTSPKPPPGLLCFHLCCLFRLQEYEAREGKGLFVLGSRKVLSSYELNEMPPPQGGLP